MKPSAHLCSWHIFDCCCSSLLRGQLPHISHIEQQSCSFRAVAIFLALETAQRVWDVWLDRDPQVTGCDVFWRMWRCKRQYYSVSTTSAISIPNMYDHSCGDSLGLELLHYLLYAAACCVSRANDTSASVKRSVGADLDWHSRQLGEPKQHSDVGASICLDENAPFPLETFYRLQRTDLSI